MWQTPVRQDHLTGTSQASPNSSRLPYCELQGTVRPLRVKETIGPVPALEGGCGGTDVVLAIPGVMEDSEPNISEWMLEAEIPHDFNSAVKAERKAVGPQR
jgi:hypothetical protein